MRTSWMMAITLLTPLSLSASDEWKMRHARPTAYESDHTMERAGLPQDFSRRATPSLEPHENPGLIGGSRLFKGDGAGQYDGTFGWDYSPWRPGRVFLSFSHDRAHQPRLGSYKTDTHKVPDPVTLHPIRRIFESRDH